MLAKGEVHVKTVDGLYRLEDNRWRLLDTRFKKPFVFYDDDFFEADFIPDEYVFSPIPMAKLIPHESQYMATKVRIGEQLFVAVSGSLFEYRISNHFKRSFQYHSVRDIFFEDSLSIISTYSGIYVNGRRKEKEEGPYYASGALCKIGQRYFLCSDELFEYHPDREIFEMLPTGTSTASGLFRKVMEYKGDIVSLNTQSINRLRDFYTLQPIHSGYEYTDLEIIQNKLVFCTTSGQVFASDSAGVVRIANLNTRIRDIFHFGNLTYLATDIGVYTITQLDSTRIARIAELPFVVALAMDKHGNLWISTERGLYVKTRQTPYLITIIPDVEFNRGAFTMHNEIVYAGSVEGIFEIPLMPIVKNFIPQYLNKKQIGDRARERKQLAVGMVVLLLFTGVLYYYYRYRKVSIPVAKKETRVIGLDEMKRDIIENNLLSVDEMAAFYKTNTVQLNRIFKTYDTTPGKFLKKVKLEYAETLRKAGIPLAEISVKTGYSAQFLKQHMS